MTLAEVGATMTPTGLLRQLQHILEWLHWDIPPPGF